MQVYEVLCLCG